MISVVDLAPHHRGGVEELFRSVLGTGYPRGVTEAGLSEWLWRTPLIHSWVALDDDRVVGHLGLASAVDSPHAPQWCVALGVASTQLAVGVRGLVAPSHRRLGVASQLAAAQQSYAREHGLKLVTDTVDDRTEAIAATEAAGFVKVGEAPYVAPDGQVCLKFLWVQP